MIWVIVSVPLWLFGGLMFGSGSYALAKIAMNPSDIQTFKTAEDGDAILISLGMIVVSAPALYFAARLVT